LSALSASNSINDGAGRCLPYYDQFVRRQAILSAPVPSTLMLSMQESLPSSQSASDPWKQLKRFLILGSENGTYDVARQELTPACAPSLVTCLREDGTRAIEAIIEESRLARAPAVRPALFALALASSPRFADAVTNRAALDAMPSLARTGEQLFQFVHYASAFRGWGRGLRAAVAGWYINRPVGELERLLLKYPSGYGWSHADLIRLAHPETSSLSRNTLFRWLAQKETAGLSEHGLWQADACERLKSTQDEAEAARLVRDFRLAPAMVPAQFEQSATVWGALVESMSYDSLLGSLAAMARAGLIPDGGVLSAEAARRIADPTRVGRSGLHPVAMLLAQTDCERCNTAAAVLEALKSAFRLAIRNVNATGRRLYVAVDDSEQMHASVCSGTQELTASRAAEAMAGIAEAVEAGATVMRFGNAVQVMSAAAHRMVETSGNCAGSHDVSTVFRDALNRDIAADAFIVYTSSPVRIDSHALEQYRERSGIAARLIAVAMSAAPGTIVAADDPLQLNIGGFDASVPEVIAAFLHGC
jgi:60 kDa SS-A/Ro ribonucleoprotein